jgi:hypothetical protein
MNPDPSKLRQQQQQAEETAELHQVEARNEFDSPEELIRFDAAHTVPPDSIAERLKESIAREPKPVRPWWKRLFGKPSGEE